MYGLDAGPQRNAGRFKQLRNGLVTAAAVSVLLDNDK
jgi:hypothetical protein